MQKLNGKELIAAGVPEGKEIGLLLDLLANQEFVNRAIQERIQEILLNPSQLAETSVWYPFAQMLLERTQGVLRDVPLDFEVYGAEGIEEGALKQMRTAMRLPVTVAGALMPDAHHGYGLPIGGVLATKNCVIPYGVGVDIGCRMALSVLDIPVDFFESNRSKFQRELIAHTRFGAGASWFGKDRADHTVLEDSLFSEIKMLGQLKDKAYSQLGTSGGGNHFVEFGILDLYNDEINLPKGKYLALLTHSGSRGLGASIAAHFTQLAKEKCKLPDEAKNLAYLSLDSEEGISYWKAMNLAGNYASACHEVIHERLVKATGSECLLKVENHHNFAWKEHWMGEELIVHRKGATPAGDGVLGFIPGSMTAPGFLVRGKGVEASLGSASHGAGRQMSRTAANKSIKRADLKHMLEDHNVKLIGGGTDEAPLAYKPIEKVMAAQKDLVDVLAQFQPKLVRMSDDGSRED